MTLQPFFFGVIYFKTIHNNFLPLCTQSELILVAKHVFYYRAPSDCYQYHTGVSGTVSSLNYAVAMLATGAYTVCIRREDGHCGISWREVATTSPDAFDLDSALTTATGNGVAAPSGAYLGIPGSSCHLYGGIYLNNDCTTTADNLDSESGIVNSIGLPFTLEVVTVTGNDGTDGFNIMYNQIPCGSVNGQTTLDMA